MARAASARRTAASLMVGGGVPWLVVSKIRNHVESGAVAEAMKMLQAHPVNRLSKEPPPPTWGKRTGGGGGGS
jgi:hypothetical protein